MTQVNKKNILQNDRFLAAVESATQRSGTCDSLTA